MKLIARLLMREWHLRLKWITLFTMSVAIALGLLNTDPYVILTITTIIGFSYPARWFYEWQKSPYSAVEYLTLPVPLLHKWVVRWLTLSVLLPLWLLACTLLATFTISLLYENIPISYITDTIPNYMFTWWIISGILAIGTMFFRRWAVTKTLLAILVITIIAQFIIMISIDWEYIVPQFEEVTGLIGLTGRYVLSLVALASGIESLDRFTAYALASITVIWLWLITWFRLREMEA